MTTQAARLEQGNASSAGKFVEVTKNEETGISIVSMARKPVNGLNLEMLTELKEAFLNVQKDGSNGVILTSSLSKVFSAGLDVMEMYKPDETRVVKFMTALLDVWRTLYGLSIPSAAAINGASPAGGCLLAMCCEYRVMVDGKHTIGLNETRLGIVAPKWLMNMMIDTIGQRQSELALMRGKLFTPQEALKVGLIDEIVANKDQALLRCSDYIAEFAGIPDRARFATKLILRGERIAWLDEHRAEDTNNFIRYLKDPDVQNGLELYIQFLKHKSKL